MSDKAARYEIVMSAAVAAVFAAFWLLAVALNDPPEFAFQYLFTAVVVALVASPWVIAVRLLSRAWWNRRDASLATRDGPARLLAAAVASLPEDRRDWGAAMAAELAHVRGRSPRWWFAFGCARAALFPPRSRRAPVLAVLLLAAAATGTAGLATGHALPAMRIFAATFVALVGSMAILAVARSRPLGQFSAHPITTTAGLAGVAAAIAVTSYFLVEHPEAAPHFPPLDAVVLASVLAGCWWLALTPPRALTTDRMARALGIAAALALGAGFLVSSRLTVHTSGGPLVWVLFAPVVIFFATSAAAALRGRSFRAGIEAAVWAAPMTTLLIFAIAIPEAMRRYGIDGRTLADGEQGHAIGVNLPGAIWGLVVIPLLGLPFGVIGAAVGSRAIRRLTGPGGAGAGLPAADRGRR
jgi:hypothetical protein